MEHSVSDRSESSPKRTSLLQWRVLLIPAALLVLTSLLALRRTQLETPDLSWWLLAVVVAALCAAIVFHARYLLRARAEHMESEQRFRQMASNIQEIFWMIDAGSRKLLYVNQAYEAITGQSAGMLEQDPSGWQDLIHPEDRRGVLARLEEAAQSGRIEEKFRIATSSGDLRWVWVRGFPVRDNEGRICRLVGTAQDITAQKEAEEEVAKNLALAECAWKEADALRKATLALTQDLRMDYILDTLLQSLAELIPYECARVLLQEADWRLFLAREALTGQDGTRTPTNPLTIDARDVPLLQRVLVKQQSVLLPDTKDERQWRTFVGHAEVRSWLCVPLVASDRVLGILTVGHFQPGSFSEEHLRRAQLLAIPAAAAIQNARLYERAEIYGAELEKRLSDLHRTEEALAQSEEGRRVSEDKFQKVFRSSPIPFSITTLNEGRFVDVNGAFERRYGYSRAELLGRTVHEVMLWEDPADRALMTTRLQWGGPIRNVVTRLRTKSGNIKLTAYSADQIQFDGQACILAVSEDLPELDQQMSN